MMESVRPNGIVILVALPRGEVSFAPTDLIEIGGSIQGSYEGGRQELKDLITIAASIGLQSEAEAIPLSGINEALDRLAVCEVIGRLVIDFRLG
jgi:propanol-preferring alcohol dehydrogenase